MGLSEIRCSRWRSAALIIAASGTAVVALSLTANGAAEESQLLTEAEQIFQPLPKDMATLEFPITPQRVELGRSLFFDPRASVDGTTSCARCHEPSLYGTDGLNKPHGARDKINPRNAPTVLNAALQFNVHWRGDRKNVEDQATQALIGPPSFGNPDYASAMKRIKAIAGYSEMFQKAFPGEQEPVTPENWGKAIGSYERTLVTPSRFDQYLSGDGQALSSAELRGLRTFIETGCVACHNGADVGGGMFQKFGVVEDYWKETGSADVDKGRFDVTHDEADMYVFKVPSLRNVAMTPPYFHDGAVNTLPESVRVMAKVQLGKDLPDRDIADIVTFLGSLTGQLPDNFRTAPLLPPGGFEPVRGGASGEGR
jgi:cytochrome c peroxidase